MTNTHLEYGQELPVQIPVLIPLGDCGLLVRFGDELSSKSNLQAVNAAKFLGNARLCGALEIYSTLVSVFIRYDPAKTSFYRLCDNVRLTLASQNSNEHFKTKVHQVEISYGGEEGPDLFDVAEGLGIKVEEFIEAHNGANLRVLAVGFAPGFIYCGLHEARLNLPRRTKLHASVPPGSILFAAGQTAITASHVPTGWHVIGRTGLRNFRQELTPPTQLNAGDQVKFSGTLTT